MKLKIYYHVLSNLVVSLLLVGLFGFSTVSVANENLFTEFENALEMEDDVLAKQIIEKFDDINVGNEEFYGLTLLHYASREGRTEIVEFLIVQGADVNANTNSGWTALMHATRSGHTETAELLIANGADVNAVDNYRRTALMWTSWAGHTEIAELLIANGADVYAVDDDGWNVLMWASRKGHIKIAELLIANGADVHIPIVKNFDRLIEPFCIYQGIHRTC